ncbi:MAG: AAA-associated domain-containing protein [Acidobacteriota bacterium]|nr:AAA-associated domain-containing protein [Acidobacteriota bacterium]
MADRIIVLSRNPARIRADFEVQLAHPRDRKAAQFVELVDYIYKILTQPREEPTQLLTEAKQAAVSEPPTMKYQMLPHARPGGIAGLMEILLDRGGRDDLHRLAADLIMEVDDLLPIVEAAGILGFVNLQEGDVEITPEGQAFAEADILTRKALFRQAALQHVRLLQQIEHALRTKSDHALPDDFFLDILEEHFSEEESQRQLDTAIHWGRYAEIFDYDAEKGRLILTEQ